MGTFLLGLATFILIVLSGFIILVILMQRASANAGMGSALGGGAAEAAFGGGSANVLSRFTIIGITAFFVITFLMYLGYMSRAERKQDSVSLLPEIHAEGEGETVRLSGLTESEAELPSATEVEAVADTVGSASEATEAAAGAVQSEESAAPAN